MLLSGEAIGIRLDRHRAVVTTVGATLRVYEVGDRSVLDGFAASEVCPDGRGQVLIPWPNRVAGGSYVLSSSGARLQLPIDEPERGHAIHGLVRWAEWQVEHRAPDAVRLRHRLAAQPGYPFPLDVRVEYRLSERGLGVHMTIANIGPRLCPVGMGMHPYFVFGRGSADDVELHLSASAWLETDERCIPTRRVPVEGSALDFRRPRSLRGVRLDHAFTGLPRDGLGFAHVVLRSGDETTRLWLGPEFAFAQVYTGDAVSDPARRRASVAVEPMTCAPDAFNSGDGLRALAPGESLEGRWGVSIA